MFFTSPPLLVFPHNLSPMTPQSLPFTRSQPPLPPLPFILPSVPPGMSSFEPGLEPPHKAQQQPTALSLGSWFDLQCRGDALRRAERSPGPLDGTCFGCTKY